MGLDVFEPLSLKGLLDPEGLAFGFLLSGHLDEDLRQNTCLSAQFTFVWAHFGFYLSSRLLLNVVYRSLVGLSINRMLTSLVHYAQNHFDLALLIAVGTERNDWALRGFNPAEPFAFVAVRRGCLGPL